ncbi:hypothetical protein AcW1_004588 [Taiwanofungus camphoratus]|nr:hypothetical protein AcW2_006407 [Antrodia cinnamomea]KAI0939619.1 hypothetical protein AcV5_000974 [Antrodia cinnamomea]KAI0952533.1 hypothetical protein AcV7_008302 [Antrodia cinnamomea]KAI0959907.1 hypothetical protein AcW1_004588 [Antrodia cinnamomea]
MTGVQVPPDALASAVLNLYSSLGFKPPVGQYTVLAAFVLYQPNCFKVISLGTGSKCLPTIRFSKEGDALHDSHAEILARRGAIRWLLEEVQRATCSGSVWLHQSTDEKFKLNDGVQVYMYVSTAPCGDASTRLLVTFQDAEMAALKGSTAFPELPPNITSRGRDNYSLYGVLRTKPGRADSPPTLSMSCSDKIARWNVLGIQGAMASHVLQPLYIAAVIIGEVDPCMQDMVREDCKRAFWERLNVVHQQLPSGFELNKPDIHFTSLSFMHSRNSLAAASSCKDSLCWIADSPKSPEVLINGFKRGVSPKHRHNPKFRPLLAKSSLFCLYEQTVSQLELQDRK